MGLDEAMIVAGIGCRKGISAHEVEAALDAALLSTSIARDQLSLIAVPAIKGSEPGIIAAAKSRGVTLRLISRSAMQAANEQTLTRSTRALAAMNVNSVAEAAALAAAGPHARLLAPRVAIGPVTCALADGEISQ